MEGGYPRPPMQAAMRKRAKWPYLVAAPFLLGVVVVVWIALGISLARHKYEFLGGRRPFLSGVFPIIEDSGYRSKGFTDEYRVYSWQESYPAVCARANRELASQGFRATASDKKSVFAAWRGPDGCAVTITPSHSRTRRGALAYEAPPDAGWVTVICVDPISDTWVSHVRYALEPRDY